MINTASARPFPENLFHDLNAEAPSELPEDFYPSFMYVLRAVTDARNSRALILRYKDGKSYDEIGELLGVSKQRAQNLITDIVSSINGENIAILRKGVKRYYEDLMMERIEYLSETLEQSEREQIKQSAYEDGYDKGFADGLVEKRTDTANIEVLDNIHIDTVPISFRTHNALQRNGIRTLGDLVRVGDKVYDFRAFGKTCFTEIAKLLESYGVSAKVTFPKTYCKWA